MEINEIENRKIRKSIKQKADSLKKKERKKENE